VSPDVAGKVIAGKYELLVPAGEGGMAVVWKAVARGAGAFAKQVAVKRIQAGKTADPSFIKMFEEEARVGSQLEHPNIVHIMDFGVDEDGGYYLVMEWCEGLDMFQWVRSHSRPGPDGSGPRATPWPLVAAIGVEVTRGLAAAHERVTPDGTPAPVYHRDVSPSNILLGVNGTVKLTDFGLARAMDRASMTRPNVIKGKLAYCAPELITGAKPSPATDVFALGVVLWEALAQRRLFVGKNDLEVLLAVRKGEVPDLREPRPDIPPPMVDAITRSLAHDPNERFRDAREMARALASVLRTASENADAEPLGTSVKAARKRLGKDTSELPMVVVQPPPPAEVTAPRKRVDAPVITTDELSASEVDLDPQRGTPKGLWRSEGSSAAVPLTQKKK
jgi:serine/threonine-protein kinase